MKTKTYPIAYAENGRPMAVIRPARPEIALIIARHAVETRAKEMPPVPEEEAGPYTFRGFLAKPARLGNEIVRIVDRDGKFLETCQPGDSFVTGDQFALDKPS